jgi:hypothetical protein
MIRYLYGDSTPSPLTTDYIAHIQNILDFSIEVLLHETRITDTIQTVENLSDTTDVEVFRAQEIVAHVFHALEQYPRGQDDSIAGRCAARIRQDVEDLVRSESRAAHAVVNIEKARAAQVALVARGACAKAFETLVQRQDPPDSVVTTKVWLQSESHYVARRLGQTPYGLNWTVESEIPASNAFAHVFRMDSISGRVEIEAPVVAGLFHREVKIRPHRFDRFYLVELLVDPTCTTIKLRASPHVSSSGYDVSLSENSSRVEVTRILAGDAVPDSSYEVSDEDAAELRSMRDALVALVGKLREGKQVLVAASFDDTPLHQLETPRQLIERLIANVAPTVAEIARRSLVPGELALKRVLSETQREEVFLSKAELLKKLEPLPAPLHRIFNPLGLWEETDMISPPEEIASNSGGGLACSAATSLGEIAGASGASARTTQQPAHENNAHGVSPCHGPLSADSLQRPMLAQPPAGVGSTGQWPTLHPSSVSLVET